MGEMVHVTPGSKSPYGIGYTVVAPKASNTIEYD